MSANGLSCYGAVQRLLFEGDEDKYELLEVKFLLHLSLRKFLDVVVKDGDPDTEKCAEVSAALVKLLDMGRIT